MIYPNIKKGVFKIKNNSHSLLTKLSENKHFLLLFIIHFDMPCHYCVRFFKTNMNGVECRMSLDEFY